MKNVVTSEVVVAYSQCPRKAFLLLSKEDKETPHDYVCIVEKQASVNRAEYLNALRQKNVDVGAYVDNIDSNRDFLIDAALKAGDTKAYCDVLTKVQRNSSSGRHGYEPTIVVGTHGITKEQRIELLFVGYVLGQRENKFPVAGTIVGADGQAHRVKLENNYKLFRTIMETLREWIATSSTDAPPVILNRHCPYCQFRNECTAKAEKDDDLSLLDRMTPKLIRIYHKKGIFTVKQLSYVFKPRRSKKRRKNTPVAFKPELQALAIRTRKIYLQELPEVSRHQVELFLDLEGIPDQNFHYLIGLLVCEGESSSYHSFWADTIQDEERIWTQFLEKVNEYSEAPIYHYGSYEPRALDKLAVRHRTSCDALKKRLVNVNSYIFGKVYFPVRSNSLKDLGKFIGASWTSPDASGLQSLVWRHHWEETQGSDYKNMLVTYNEEDCQALRLLTEELSKLQTTADSQLHVDFADQPKKNATEIGDQIHKQFKQILKSAHAEYDRKRISIRPKSGTESIENKKPGAQKGHQGYRRIPPSKAGKVIRVASRRKCPKHKDEPLRSKEMAKKTIIDLVFTKNGCRKTIIKYMGMKRYCQRCCKYYYPPGIEKLGTQLYGRGFQAWTIYQRIVLRLPYRVSIQMMEDLFGERASEGSLINFIKNFSQYYASTENMLLQRILKSPFVHVDETRLNIRGTDHCVWVFTDGKHVIFKMTETREATIVHEVLKNFKGVLVSDFYGGYDSVQCEQQKCLVHLIRDLNEDLWNAPFDTEFESFVLEVKNLFVPILEAVGKYGSKKRHLNKFQKPVEQFYRKNIVGRDYKGETSIKYQKRFQRYKQSLFTFLEKDSIPWNNNMAERAIRHLAVQRKISGYFFESSAHQYLVLLGIAQTCRFQGKSFLKFLMSGEKDVDTFKASRRIKTSAPVARQAARESDKLVNVHEET